MAIAGGDGTAESIGVVRATVDRVVALGFEVRVELTSAATGGAVHRPDHPRRRRGAGAREGDTVYVRATRVPPIPSDVVVPRGGTGVADEDQSTLTSA